MIVTYLLLCKVFIRLDQPNTALEYYTKASETFVGEISLVLGSARIHDALNDIPRGIQFYKKVFHPSPLSLSFSSRFPSPLFSPLT